MKIFDDFVAGAVNHFARRYSHNSRGSNLDKSAGAPVQGGITNILLRFVEEIKASTGGLVEVYADRAKLSVRRTFVHAGVAAGVGICAAVWLGAGTLATFRGVCGGFTALFAGRRWLGDLTGGLLALTFATGAVALFLRWSARREFQRLQAKYERIRNEPTKNHDIQSPANNGSGVA